MKKFVFRTLGAIGAVASVAIFFACSSGTGSTGGASGAPVPVDQVGKVFVEKVCGAIGSCCSQNGFSSEYANCNSATAAAAFQADFEKSRAKHPEATYDPQRAGNCFAKLAASLSTCNTKNSPLKDDADQDCDGVFRGAKPAGGACTSSTDCAPGLHCTGTIGTADGGTVSGTCYATKQPAAGDPCLDYEDKPNPSKVYGDCHFGDDAFYCDRESKTCKPRGGVGTACVVTSGTSTFTDSTICTKDTMCDYPTKVCVARRAVGEDCSASECADGTYCDQSTKKCAAKKAAGASCASSEECLHGCDKTSKQCQTNDIDRSTCAGTDFN